MPNTRPTPSEAPKKESSAISHLYNKEPKKLNKPTGAIQQSLVGINDLLKKQDKKEEVTPSLTDSGTLLETPFSIDELRMNWRRYAHIAKNENIGTLYNAMMVKDPNLREEYEITYTVPNEVQLQFIETHKIEILTFLRKELKNHKIQLSLKVETTVSETLVTSREKYDDMIKRNPKLDLLKDRFNLDLEF